MARSQRSAFLSHSRLHSVLRNSSINNLRRSKRRRGRVLWPHTFPAGNRDSVSLFPYLESSTIMAFSERFAAFTQRFKFFILFFWLGVLIAGAVVGLSFIQKTSQQ